MSLLTNATDLAIEKDLKQFLIILLVALSAASLPKIFAGFRQIPYTLLLVIVGCGLALFQFRLINLSPGMILLIFLPPILFEAAWNMKWGHLRQEAVPSFLFAVGGVFISVAGIAWALHQWMDVPWVTALLTGSCLSATDSASVLGVFRQVGAGRRLTTLLEGESLFNDGASVVAFSVFMELAIHPHPVEISQTILQFLIVSGVGVGIGGLIGLCVAVLTQRYNLSWVEQSLTLVTAYGSYILVEDLGGSGVIGVVTAGLVIGNFNTVGGVDIQKRLTLIEFWEFVTFFINSIVFLLLGDQVLFPYFLYNVGTTSVCIVAVIASRAIAIFGFSALSGLITKRPIPLVEQIVLWWAGLRGGVSIALALSLPITVMNREQIISNSFGVVFFTLLVQGLTTKLLMEKLNLLEDKSINQKYLELVARRNALLEVLNHLIATEKQSLIEPTIYQKQIEFAKQQIKQFQEDIDLMEKEHLQLQEYNLQQHQNKLLEIETKTYTKFIQEGLLPKNLSSIMQKSFES